MITLLYASSCSACFEWNNNLSYFNNTDYTVTLNGKEVLTANTNVFSLFGLSPATHYVLGIVGSDFSLEFSTAGESCCVFATDFGAVGDGKFDCTSALQSAIDCLPKNGRLQISAGTYLTAPLTLKSNITIELCSGATLLGCVDESRYPVLPGVVRNASGKPLVCGSWEGNPSAMHKSLIFGERIANVAIVGQGCIDGNAQNSTWWQNVRMRKVGRPRLCFLNDCKNIVFHGVTAQNAASWQFHPYYSKNVSFLDVSVFAPKNSPNTDALDPESCDVVNIIGCRFSVGDDCIAIKSGKSCMTKINRRSANRHTVRNCLMRDGHGAITLGSEMSCGVTNLTVNRCVFQSTDRGLRIKSRRGRGKYAVIDGVLFENIQMDNVLTPIVINMYYYCCDPDRFGEYVWSRQKLPVDDGTPRLGKFTFRNMQCVDCHVAAAHCDGLPESPIGQITLENIKFSFAQNAKSGVPAMASFVKPMCKAGLYFNRVGKLDIHNVTFEGVEGDEIVAENIGEINRE